MAKDVVMSYFEDDIKKIQVKTNLYIKSYGSAGAFHLFKEVAQNSIDECIDMDSMGSMIDIRIDKKTDRAIIEDDGRGFPEKDFPLDIFCTKIQSGSKFYRDQSGGTSGEFGLGLTAVNALSSHFEITNYREKENTKHTISFDDGVKKRDVMDKLSDGKKHGARITFSPSKYYLGANTEIPVDDVKDWLSRISYLLPDRRKIKINLTISNGLQNAEKIKYKSKPFSTILDDRLAAEKDIVLTKKVFAKGTRYVDETIAGNVKQKQLDLEFVFQYIDPTSITALHSGYDSYCNFTHTIAGGIHVDAVDDCLCRFFVPKVRAILNNKEKETMEIKWDDVRTGLCCAINLSTNAQVDFQGNMKEEIGNKDLIQPMKEIVNAELEKYFSEHEEHLKQILKLIKLNAKVRIEATKVRTKIAKNAVTKWNTHEISNFRDVQKMPGKRISEEAKYELFIIEGEKSALGTAVDGRDPSYQALYGVRGMTKNVYSNKLSEILDPKNGNREWVNYEKVLECGYGDNFDINRLKWDKIIIMSDADIDGSGISQGVAAYHLYVHPEIVQAGRLYKVLPPLYSIGKKKDDLSYARDKMEKIEMDFKEIGKNMTFELVGKKKSMGKSEVKEFLYDTINYLSDLTHAAKHYSVDKFFLERIVAFIALTVSTIGKDTDVESLMQNQNFRTNLVAFVQEYYPEISLIGTDSLRGTVNLHEQSIQITNRFIENTIDLYESIKKYGELIKVTDKNQEPEVISIGQALTISTKYAVRIFSRFKGLGEMDSDELWDTTMNPDTRLLVRLTSDDLKKELETFQMLNGKRKKDLEGRKNLLRGRRIRMEDLDG